MNKNCINNLKSVYFIISFLTVKVWFIFFCYFKRLVIKLAILEFNILATLMAAGWRSLSVSSLALSLSRSHSQWLRGRERMRSLAVVVCFVVVVVGCLCAAASYAAFRCSCASKLCCQLIFSN